MIGVKTITAIILILLQSWPKNPAHKNVDQLARDFMKYSVKYNIDPVLLAVVGFHESSLRTDQVGGLGEVGMFQVHGRHRGICEAANISPLGVECGALLLDMDTRFCGSVRDGLHRYMSGSCDGTPRARRMTKFRLRRVKALKGKISK